MDPKSNPVYDVKPLVSVGGVPFGADRTEARAAFGSGFREFRKGPFAKNTSDSYGSLVLFYTPDDRLEAVEFYDSIPVTVDGTPFSWEYEAAKLWILSLDPGAEIDEWSMTSVAESIGMSVDDGNCESLLFGAPGYYA